jgi:tetratricopeptide (TPR) repeat protein
MLLVSGDADLAIVAFREAIALAARSGAGPHVRANLYREIGRAQEARGDLPQAYDAFKMALRLNPEEPYARKRVDEMEAAAGKK